MAIEELLGYFSACIEGGAIGIEVKISSSSLGKPFLIDSYQDFFGGIFQQIKLLKKIISYNWVVYFLRK